MRSYLQIRVGTSQNTSSQVDDASETIEKDLAADVKKRGRIAMLRAGAISGVSPYMLTQDHGHFL